MSGKVCSSWSTDWIRVELGVGQARAVVTDAVEAADVLEGDPVAQAGVELLLPVVVERGRGRGRRIVVVVALLGVARLVLPHGHLARDHRLLGAAGRAHGVDRLVPVDGPGADLRQLHHRDLIEVRDQGGRVRGRVEVGLRVMGQRALIVEQGAHGPRAAPDESRVGGQAGRHEHMREVPLVAEVDLHEVCGLVVLLIEGLGLAHQLLVDGEAHGGRDRGSGEHGRGQLHEPASAEGVDGLDA